MKIMCIHGIGHKEERTNTWRKDWEPAITQAIGEWSPTTKVEIQQFAYDDLFDAADSSSLVYLTAMVKLLKSWVVHSGERDIFGLFDKYRWTVGMVAQFVALNGLRADLRNKLATEIGEFAPDVILAHSLGSLIAYDTLSSSATKEQVTAFNGRLVTFGSQIAHPAVSEVFGGRIQYPGAVARWWNLFNENDMVLSCRIVLPAAPMFKEINTPFEFEFINHDADHYLLHEQTRSECRVNSSSASTVHAALRRWPESAVSKPKAMRLLPYRLYRLHPWKRNDRSCAHCWWELPNTPTPAMRWTAR